MHERSTQQAKKEVLDALHVGDVKSAYVPPTTLGKMMVGKIPMSALYGNILVVSDAGLLVAMRKRIKELVGDTSKIVFLCHTEKLRGFAMSLGITTWFIPYGKELNEFLNTKNTKGYNLKEMKFDVIVGNPPYQPETKDRGKSKGSGTNIWHLFVEKTFELTNNGAHILFVTPDKWKNGTFKRQSHSHIQKMMFENTIKWYTNCRTPIDYFSAIHPMFAIGAWHIQKHDCSYEPKTTLERLRLYVDNDKMRPIVEKFFTICENSISIEMICGGKKIGEIEKSLVGDKEHPYRYAHTTAQVKDGKYHWHTEKDRAYDLKKVITCWSGKFVLGYDGGGCGLGQCTQAYIVDNETIGRQLEAFLRSPIIGAIVYQFIIEGVFLFPIEFFAKLPKQILELEWKGDVWKESAKKVFGFTDEEIERIQK